MTVLGLDTATGSTVAALLRPGGKVVEAAHHPGPDEKPGHAERLLACVEQVMEGVEWDAVERIAVGVGPGGFTGMRIGIATARALAQARGIPVVPVSTLQALAANGEGERDTILAVIDARRKEVFAAAWQGERRVLAPEALRPEDLARRVAELRPLAVGDGAVRYRAQLEASGAVVPSWAGAHRVDGGAICRLGAKGTPVPLADLLPDYIREPDAKPPKPRTQ
jgi:tRNA threonylcarbamoyladenosine biosynthesis protein TsaB